MISRQIVDFLEKHDVSYERHAHRRACTAQELAAATHVPGRRVAKSVIVKGGDQIWIAVLPASEVVDEKLLADVLGVPSVRLLDEADFEGFFPGCEPGAEPPFGSLFGLPVVIDSTLAEAGRIVFRAGSHDEVDRDPLRGLPPAGAQPEDGNVRPPSSQRAPRVGREA